MSDRDKLISALECNGGVLDANGGWECSTCPYCIVMEDESGPWSECDTARMFRDAVELLREQEPVLFDEIGYQPVCGACNESLDVTDEYCRNCGRKVRWKRA